MFFGPSALNSGKKARGEWGSAWANSMAGSQAYKRYWHPSLFGGVVLFPVVNLEEMEPIDFEDQKVGGEPIGYRMRTLIYLYIHIYIYLNICPPKKNALLNVLPHVSVHGFHNAVSLYSYEH